MVKELLNLINDKSLKSTTSFLYLSERHVQMLSNSCTIDQQWGAASDWT